MVVLLVAVVVLLVEVVMVVSLKVEQMAVLVVDETVDRTRILRVLPQAIPQTVQRLLLPLVLQADRLQDHLRCHRSQSP